MLDEFLIYQIKGDDAMVRAFNKPEISSRFPPAASVPLSACHPRVCGSGGSGRTAGGHSVLREDTQLASLKGGRDG